MKKKDLKSKMIVALRNGDFYLVVDDVLVRENSFIILSKYDDNLLYEREKESDVVEVYKIVNNYYSFTNDLGIASLEFKNIGRSGALQLLWKRTYFYDGGDLIEGEKVWIISKIGGLSVVYNFDSKYYNEEYKYFCSETTAQIYLSVLNRATFSFKNYVKMSEKEFGEYCENVIREEFLRRLKDEEL